MVAEMTGSTACAAASAGRRESSGRILTAAPRKGGVCSRGSRPVGERMGREGRGGECWMVEVWGAVAQGVWQVLVAAG